jgi:hypothetical protein
MHLPTVWVQISPSPQLVCCFYREIWLAAIITKYLQVSAWREKYPEYPGLRRRDKVVDEKPRFAQREKRAGDRLGSGKNEKCPVEDRGDFWLDRQYLAEYCGKCACGGGCSANDVEEVSDLIKRSIEANVPFPPYKKKTTGD